MSRYLVSIDRNTGMRTRIEKPSKYLPRPDTPKSERTIPDAPRGLNPAWVEAKKRGLV